MDFPQISPDESHLKLFILCNDYVSIFYFYFFKCRPCTVNKRFLLFRIDKLLGFGGYLVPDGARLQPEHKGKSSPTPSLTQGRDWVTEVGGNSSMSLEERGERGA